LGQNSSEQVERGGSKQPSFFDQEDRLAKLEKLGDPLLRLDSIVDWQTFRPLLKVIHQKQRKSNAGHNPNMKRQKDADARWTRKHRKGYYGYKNPINIDKELDLGTHRILGHPLDTIQAGLSRFILLACADNLTV
jgi:hypothetical protein